MNKANIIIIYDILDIINQKEFNKGDIIIFIDDDNTKVENKGMSHRSFLNFRRDKYIYDGENFILINDSIPKDFMVPNKYPFDFWDYFMDSRYYISPEACTNLKITANFEITDNLCAFFCKNDYHEDFLIVCYPREIRHLIKILNSNDEPLLVEYRNGIIELL